MPRLILEVARDHCMSQSGQSSLGAALSLAVVHNKEHRAGVQPLLISCSHGQLSC